MHSNGGRGGVPEGISSAVSESRRAGHVGGSRRRRSYADTDLIADAGGDWSTIVSTKGLSSLFVCDDRVLRCRPVPSQRSETAVASGAELFDIGCMTLNVRANRQNENRTSIAFSIEFNS